MSFRFRWKGFLWVQVLHAQYIVEFRHLLNGLIWLPLNFLVIHKRSICLTYSIKLTNELLTSRDIFRNNERFVSFLSVCNFTLFQLKWVWCLQTNGDDLQTCSIVSTKFDITSATVSIGILYHDSKWMGKREKYTATEVESRKLVLFENLCKNNWKWQIIRIIGIMMQSKFLS